MFCFGHKLTSFTYSAKMNKTTKSVTNQEYTLQKCLSWIISKWDFCQNQPNLHNYHNLQNYKFHKNHCNTILKQDTLCMTQDKFGKHKSRGFREDFWKSLQRTTGDGKKLTRSFGSGELKRNCAIYLQRHKLYKSNYSKPVFSYIKDVTRIIMNRLKKILW
jgi:hypothetical protein